jgi:hypothetical protein
MPKLKRIALSTVRKQALGERGPVWWMDGAPDLNRHMVTNTRYAAWLARELQAVRALQRA